MFIMNFIKKIINKIKSTINKPGDLFRFGTPAWRNNYFLISKILRKNILEDRAINNSNEVIIDNDMGYHFDNSIFLNKNFHSNLSKAVDYSNEKIDKYIKLNKSNNNSKDYLQSVLSKNDFEASDPIIKIAMDDYFVDMASNYLGMIPLIGQIHLWYSPNNSQQDEGSQFFHLDYADIKQFKVFIMLDDIDDNSGPLTFIPALNSKIISESINYKLSNEEIRVPDEIVEKYVNKDSWIKATGKKGEVLYIDTCRCMHFGSRNGIKPRRILMIQYITPFSFTLPWKYKGSTYLSDVFRKDDNFESLPHNKKILIGL